jgi:hypothetical protein
MKLLRRQFLYLAAGAAALPAVSRIARAQTYPSRPVRIIAPTGPGGAPDILARLIGSWLSERLGRQNDHARSFSPPEHRLIRIRARSEPRPAPDSSQP